ncbi:predicted protein [Streptomyces sp. SPB78]|nr:predicted protein [Streptomyces sp. SPB78]
MRPPGGGRAAATPGAQRGGAASPWDRGRRRRAVPDGRRQTSQPTTWTRPARMSVRKFIVLLPSLSVLPWDCRTPVDQGPLGHELPGAQRDMSAGDFDARSRYASRRSRPVSIRRTGSPRQLERD